MIMKDAHHVLSARQISGWPCKEWEEEGRMSALMSMNICSCALALYLSVSNWYACLAMPEWCPLNHGVWGLSETDAQAISNGHLTPVHLNESMCRGQQQAFLESVSQWPKERGWREISTHLSSQQARLWAHMDESLQ